MGCEEIIISMLNLKVDGTVRKLGDLPKLGKRNMLSRGGTFMPGYSICGPDGGGTMQRILNERHSDSGS